MAVPLALPLALIGGLAGHSAQPARWRNGSPQVACAAFLALPMMLGVERLGDTEAPLLAVKSSIEVNAPPARVWRHVVTFSELPAPTEWLFRAGIAYPLRAEIQGTGPGRSGIACSRPGRLSSRSKCGMSRDCCGSASPPIRRRCRNGRRIGRFIHRI